MAHPKPTPSHPLGECDRLCRFASKSLLIRVFRVVRALRGNLHCAFRLKVDPKNSGQRPGASQPRASEARAPPWASRPTTCKAPTGRDNLPDSPGVVPPRWGCVHFFPCHPGRRRASLALGWLVAGPSALSQWTHFHSHPDYSVAKKSFSRPIATTDRRQNYSPGQMKLQNAFRIISPSDCSHKSAAE